MSNTTPGFDINSYKDGLIDGDVDRDLVEMLARDEDKLRQAEYDITVEKFDLTREQFLEADAIARAETGRRLARTRRDDGLPIIERVKGSAK